MPARREAAGREVDVERMSNRTIPLVALACKRISGRHKFYTETVNNTHTVDSFVSCAVCKKDTQYGPLLGLVFKRNVQQTAL